MPHARRTLCEQVRRSVRTTPSRTASCCRQRQVRLHVALRRMALCAALTHARALLHTHTHTSLRIGHECVRACESPLRCRVLRRVYSERRRSGAACTYGHVLEGDGAAARVPARVSASGLDREVPVLLAQHERLEHRRELHEQNSWTIQLRHQGGVPGPGDRLGSLERQFVGQRIPRQGCPRCAHNSCIYSKAPRHTPYVIAKLIKICADEFMLLGKTPTSAAARRLRFLTPTGTECSLWVL